MRHRLLVALADEHVPITLVCRLVGLDIPDEIGVRSLKTRCPFGDLYHPDLGVEAAFRVYSEANDAYCFAGCGHFTPTRLAALAWDTNRAAAAADLLDRIGYHSTLSSVWEPVAPPAPDRLLLAEALKVYCARVDPHWAAHQFAGPVAQTLRRALSLLDRVDDDDGAARWLDAAKAAMDRAFTSHVDTGPGD